MIALGSLNISGAYIGNQAVSKIMYGGENLLPDALAAGTWEYCSPLLYNCMAVACEVWGNNIYGMGGFCNSSYYAEGHNQVYSTTLDSTTELSRIPMDVSWTAVSTYGNYIYIFGGILSTGWATKDIYVYDINNDSYTLHNTSLLDYRLGACRVKYNNKCYLFGGVDDWYNALAGSMCFDFTTGAISTSVSLTGVRGFMGGVNYGSNAYIIGGYCDNSVTSECLVINLATSTISTISSLPEPKGYNGVAIYGSKIYVAGGVDASYDYLDTCYVYDIPTDTWSTMPSLNQPKLVSNLSCVSETLYILGGSYYDGVDDYFMNSIEKYAL